MASEPKTKITVREAEQPTPEAFSQRKQPEQGQFRLQVDRQTKSSYASFEAAETAGLAIKKAFPSLQVAVYNHKESINQIIELPKA